MKGEPQMVNLSEKLKAGGIAHKLWIEQPENFPTCLATKPYPKSMHCSRDRKTNWHSSPEKIKISINSMARRVEANIYREAKIILDLYVILLQFSSLVSETIPCHRDYQTYPPRERILYRKKLLDVLDELESLKAEAQRLVSKLNEAHAVAQLPQLESLVGTSNGLATSSLEWPPVSNKSSSLSARQAAMVEKCTTVL